MSRQSTYAQIVGASDEHLFRAGRPLLEALEPRLLLSAAWEQQATDSAVAAAVAEPPPIPALMALPGAMNTAEGFVIFHSDGISHDTQYSASEGKAYIGTYGDVDSYYFSGDILWDGTYTLRANAPAGGPVDPILAVYSASTAQMLGSDDNSGPGNNAELSLTLLATQRYIVAVADATDSHIGDIELIIESPYGTAPTVVNLAADGSGSSSVSLGLYDSDYFRFTTPANANGHVWIDISPSVPAGVIPVLFDAAGTEVQNWGIEGYPGHVKARELTPSTDYFVTVLSRDYITQGSFDLSVDFEVLQRIQGIKWNDLDGDGTHGGGEPGLPGSKVFLDMNNNGVLDTYTVTLEDLEGNQWTKIPDGGHAMRPIDVFLPGGRVVDVDLHLYATHDDAVDLSIMLSRPDLSTYCDLFWQGDVSGGYLTGTVFDDEAATSITAGASPYTGHFSPRDALSAFDGQEAKGEWFLVLSDEWPGNGKDGRLEGWRLELTVEEPSTVTNRHGQYAFEDVPAGAYVVADAPDPGWEQTGLTQEGLYYGGGLLGDVAVADAAGRHVSVQGNYGIPSLLGMAYDSKDHVLYALGPGTLTDDVLLRVDPITLTIAEVGRLPDLGGDSNLAKALSYNVLDDMLYCGLIRIDPETLTATGSNPSPPASGQWLHGGALNPTAVRSYLYYYRSASPKSAAVRSYNALPPHGSPISHPAPSVPDSYGMTFNGQDLIVGVLGTNWTDLSTYSLISGTVLLQTRIDDMWLYGLAYMPTTLGAHAVVVEEGSDVTGVDFLDHGLPTSEITGRKWHDVDGDGDWDAGEPPRADWFVFLDSNNNGQIDHTTATHISSDVGRAVRDQRWTVSELNITGAPRQILDVDVVLTIEHEYDADLHAYLISPAGTEVELFTEVGGYDENFINTRLSDEAATSIAAGSAPFTGTYRPEDPVGLMAVDGEDPNGRWALAIYDDAWQDEGRLVSWSLVVEAVEPRQATDSFGEYTFANLAPGMYIVSEQQQAWWQQTYPHYRAGAVSYQFEDISHGGTPVMAGGDDDFVHLTAAQLGGFAFEFYGTAYSDVYFNSNGLITFGSGDNTYRNDSLLDQPVQACIAAFWDDLKIPSATAAYWQVLGPRNDQRLIIQWEDVVFFQGDSLGTITFQAVLKEVDGTIQLNYQDLDSSHPGAGGTSATVGIKAAGTYVDRLLLCYNNGPTRFVGTGLSTRITPGGGGHHVVHLGTGQTWTADFGNYQQPYSTPPGRPDLLPGSDTGQHNNDNLTHLDNSSAQKTLQFSVGGTVPGAAVTLYADGAAVGSAVAAGTSVTITTNGTHDLIDGSHLITARQTEPGKQPSGDSPALTVSIDTVGPRVVDALVSAAGWAQSFLNFLSSQGLGSGGYSIPVGSSDQLDPLPWVNLDQVKAVFNEDVDIATYQHMSLHGVTVPNYAPNGLAYNPGTRTAVLYLTAAIEADKLLLVVDDTVRDIAGNALDGEWTNAVSSYPSGDGAAGGDFRFRFNALPGDVDGSGEVRSSDTIKVRRKSNTVPGDADYSVFYDVDGSGDIRAGDTIKVRRKSNTELPAGEPIAPPVAPPAPSIEADLIAAALRAARRTTDRDLLSPLRAEVLSLAQIVPLAI